MANQVDIIQNISSIYDSNNSLRILKDFERVIDELNLYVFKNWEDGELVSGPKVSRHWVECSFYWPYKKMPDPMGGKRLLEFGCKVSYSKDEIEEPRRIKKPSDIRPASKKGKMDKHPIWIVNIKMPKQLIFDIFKGTVRNNQDDGVDLESIYHYTDAEPNAPTNVAADANAAASGAGGPEQEQIPNAPAM
jgi:hypothetical protein